MLVFMKHLMNQLGRENPGWQEKTVSLFDGARYHTSEEMREYLQKLQVKVIYSGPYAYSGAPIEMVFSALKQGELNPHRLPVGKR